MGERLKYNIMKNDQLGRFLTAAEDLKKGTLIFTDTPFVVGPKPDSPVICLGCHKQWKGSYICSQCKWPCCDEACEEKPNHRDFECKVFSESKVSFQPVIDVSIGCMQFECITPLRMLLAIEKDPKRWESEVTVMEDHNEDRRMRITWEMDEVNIVKFLLGPCQLSERFTEELIEKVCGILEVNAVETPLFNGRNLRGIYPRVAIMSHSCVPNIVHIITVNEKEKPFNYSIEIRAAADIKMDDKLELCYTQVLNCTIQRRAHLKLSKFFDCMCERCADPTELGTNLSTMRCNNCEEGRVLAVEPLDNNSLWKCNVCNFSTTTDVISNVIDLVDREILRNEKENVTSGRHELEKKEQDLIWYYSILGQHHGTLVNLKYTLLQMYGNTLDYSYENLSQTHLRRKLSLCQEVMKILNVLAPGYSRIRGTLLYEMHIPMTILTKKDFVNGKIQLEEYYDRMSEVADVLKESATILIREDERGNNGKLGRIAMKLHKDMVATLKKL